MAEFIKTAEDVIEEFETILEEKSLDGVRFEYITNNEQKTLVKISKIPANLITSINKDVLVTFNESLFDLMEDDSIKILFEQEIDKIQYNLEKGTVKLVKPDFNTFSSILNKYGVDKVTKANQVLNLTVSQSEDLANQKKGESILDSFE